MTISLRMSPERHDLLKQAAALDERTLTAFILRAAEERARALLAQAGARQPKGGN